VVGPVQPDGNNSRSRPANNSSKILIQKIVKNLIV